MTGTYDVPGDYANLITDEEPVPLRVSKIRGNTHEIARLLLSMPDTQMYMDKPSDVNELVKVSGIVLSADLEMALLTHEEDD